MSTYSCPGRPGDLVVFIRNKGLYRHYAVNVGNDYVIHYAISVPDDDRVNIIDVLRCSILSNIAEIKKQKYSEFVKPKDKVIVETGSWRGKPPLPVEKIIERAHSRIDEGDYSVLWQNCEHFSRWCRFGEEASDQTDCFFTALALIPSSIMRKIKDLTSWRLAIDRQGTKASMGLFFSRPTADLLVFTRNTHEHYAVNVGDGYIIHATSVSDDRVGSFDVVGLFSSTRSNIAVIKKEKYSDFAKPGDEVRVEKGSWRGKPPLPVKEIIERAHSKIDERDYSVLWNNCEHFARWFCYGEKESDQADGLIHTVFWFTCFILFCAIVIGLILIIPLNV